MSYSEKLKDPRWQKKRLEILERDNWECQHCGDKETTLHVHHDSYSGEPWETKNSELTTLCKDCHWFEEYVKDYYSGYHIIKVIRIWHYPNSKIGIVVIGCDFNDSSLNHVLLFSLSKENPLFVICLQPFQTAIMEAISDLTMRTK